MVTRYGPRVTVARLTVRSSPTGNVPRRKTLSRQKTICYTVGPAVWIFLATTRTFMKDMTLSQQGRGAALHVWINERHGRGMLCVNWPWMLLLTAPMDTIILQSCSPASTTPLLQKSKHQFPTTATSLIKASYSSKHITVITFLSLKFVITLCWAKLTRLVMTICTWDLGEPVWTRGRRQRLCKKQGKVRFKMKLYWIINWSIMYHQVSYSNCSTHLICTCIPLLVS